MNEPNDKTKTHPNVHICAWQVSYVWRTPCRIGRRRIVPQSSCRPHAVEPCRSLHLGDPPWIHLLPWNQCQTAQRSSVEKKGKTSYKIELHYENFKNEILHFMYVICMYQPIFFSVHKRRQQVWIRLTKAGKCFLVMDFISVLYLMLY